MKNEPNIDIAEIAEIAEMLAYAVDNGSWAKVKKAMDALDELVEYEFTESQPERKAIMKTITIYEDAELQRFINKRTELRANFRELLDRRRNADMPDTEDFNRWLYEEKQVLNEIDKVSNSIADLIEEAVYDMRIRGE